MEEKQVAKILVKQLTNLGFVIHRYNSVTTDSIYLKLDYGVCCGIRISNHSGKKKYHYRFNLIKNYNGDKITYFENLISYFYNFEELPELIKDIQGEKANKIKKYGLEKYKEIMKRKAISNELFTRFKEVRE